MDHPLHDDSHIPAAIESTEERIEELVYALTEEAIFDVLVDWYIDYLTKLYKTDENEFQKDWAEYMERR